MSPAMIHDADVASGTFVLLLVVMAGTTVLLLVGGAWVSPRWKLPLALASLVTLAGTFYYLIAGAIWLFSHKMPIVLRYVDWIVAAPLQVLCLYFLIATAGSVPVGLFWRLLAASVAMMLARYMGEAQLIYPTLGFLIGLVLWLYVLGEVFFGRLSEINAKSASEPVQLGFFWLRLIVTIGWALYPLAYLVVRLGSGADDASMAVIYNLADLVNQVAFVLAILATAVNDSAHSR
jgi:sensory rhodopsin